MQATEWHHCRLYIWSHAASSGATNSFIVFYSLHIEKFSPRHVNKLVKLPFKKISLCKDVILDPFNREVLLIFRLHVFISPFLLTLLPEVSLRHRRLVHPPNQSPHSWSFCLESPHFLGFHSGPPPRGESQTEDYYSYFFFLLNCFQFWCVMSVRQSCCR